MRVDKHNRDKNNWSIGVYTIEIVKSSRPNLWYANKIGQRFRGEIDAWDDWSDGFETEYGFVKYGDCRIIIEAENVRRKN